MSDFPDQPSIVTALKEGAAFGARPDYIGTHLSHLFLLPDRVYKMKRAVTLNFADLSHPEKRAQCCADEVRLNAPGAPGLYRRAVPVTRDGNTFALGGSGEIVEWLVEMNRFDDTDLFDRMALDHTLTCEHLKQVAERVIAVHARAGRRPDKCGAAYMQQNASNVRNNLLNFGAGIVDPGDVERWYAAVANAFTEQGALMDARREEGFVRQCHGDLHLGNLCLYNGDPCLFDCIEFNDDLSCIDVLYDLAFLVMDLHYRGMAADAIMVLNRYLSATRDYAGLPLMPAFMSLRAAIRAMVMAIDVHDGIADTKELRDEIRAHLALALQLIEPTTPKLIAIGGLSGTGKSTLANSLAALLSPCTIVLSSDVIRKRLYDVAPETTLPRDAYRPTVSAETYARLYEDVHTALMSGAPVIADATFIREEDRGAIEAIAARLDLPFIGIWLNIDDAQAAERLAARTGDASDANLTVRQHQQTEETGSIDWIPLDASSEDLPAQALVLLTEVTRKGEST